MGLRGVVSKVKIRDQGDLKSRKRRTLFDDDRILPHIDPSCMQDTVNADHKDQANGKAAKDHEIFRHGMQHGRVPVFHKEGMAGDTADHVEGDDKKQDIFQSAEPVVADHPEKMVKWFFCDQKSGQRADGKKQVEDCDRDPEKQ